MKQFTAVVFALIFTSLCYFAVIKQCIEDIHPKPSPCENIGDTITDGITIGDMENLYTFQIK